MRAEEFTFDEALPGTYILEAKPAAETEDRPPLVGFQVISVGNEDLDRDAVEMKPASA